MNINRITFATLILFAINYCQSLYATDIKEWLYEHRYAVIGTACAATVLVCSYVRKSKLKQKHAKQKEELKIEIVQHTNSLVEPQVLLLLPSDTITLDVITEKQKLFEEKMNANI